MSEISAQLVKQLRERTGAGMMECKKALVAANGDLEEAVVVLRKRGLASADKKSTRITRQGLIVAKGASDGQVGVLVEVNCESDFVARTDDFLELTAKLSETVASAPASVVGAAEPVPALLDSPLDGATVQDYIKTKIAKLGENISVARFARFEAAGSGVVGSYIHPGAQLGVLIEVGTSLAGAADNADIQELVKDVAMQIAAADPRYLRREDVTPEAIKKEKDIQKARVVADGKPEKVAEKIVEGRMGKFFEEICLLEQPFIKEGTMTVAELVKAKAKAVGADIQIVRYARYKVGETAPAEAAPAE